MNATVQAGFLTGSAALLASAIVTPFLAGRRKLAGWLGVFFAAVAGAAYTAAAAAAFGGGGGPSLLDLGFLRIHLLIDGFSALFLALISLMGALAALYSVGYMEHYADYRLTSYCVHYPLFLLGMAGIVTVDDLSTGFTIAWQLMTISSFFLIRFDHKDRAIVRSANRYLLLMEAAWALIVVGGALVSGGALGEPLHRLTEGLSGAGASRQTAVYALLLVGFGLKAGVFPLGQLWLPDAHSSAPSPVSALLSGVMIKTGVYGIVRTLFWMFPPSAEAGFGGSLGVITAAFGAVTLFIGTVQALKQHDAKRLHAYHSIGQMGYILLGIGSAHAFLLSGEKALVGLALLALVGAIYHAVNHAVFKGLLFLCTGSVQFRTGTKDLNRLGGLIRLMPATAVAAAIAAASIAGVPAFSGFMSKWAVISSGLLAGREAAPFVFFGVIALMTSAITLASYVKFFGMTFTSSGIEWSGRSGVREVGATMLVPQGALALLCVLQGMLPFVFFGGISAVFAFSEGSIVQGAFVSAGGAIAGSGLGIAVRTPGGLPVAAATPVILAIVVAVAAGIALWLRRSGGGARSEAEVWLCGYQRLNDANRYRSSNMYAAFKDFMKWTGGNDRGA